MTQDFVFLCQKIGNIKEYFFCRYIKKSMALKISSFIFYNQVNHTNCLILNTVHVVNVPFSFYKIAIIFFIRLCCSKILAMATILL